MRSARLSESSVGSSGFIPICRRSVSAFESVWLAGVTPTAFAPRSGCGGTASSSGWWPTTGPVACESRSDVLRILSPPLTTTTTNRPAAVTSSRPAVRRTRKKKQTIFRNVRGFFIYFSWNPINIIINIIVPHKRNTIYYYQQCDDTRHNIIIFCQIFIINCHTRTGTVQMFYTYISSKSYKKTKKTQGWTLTWVRSS